MKPLLIAFLFSIICTPMFGQYEATGPLRNNQVNLIVTDLLNGSFLFGYERAVGKHSSVSLFAGFKSKDGLLKLSGLDTDQFKTGDLTYSGTRFIPEYRYYLKERTNGMLTGFYFGGYFTIVNYKSDFEGTYTNENGSFPFNYEAKINTNSLGLLIGYKLAVSNRFSIDFMMMGPGAGKYKVKLKEVVPAPVEFWVDLNDALELYSILDLINADFDFSESNSNESLVLPSFRYGITLGYSF